MHDWMDFNRDGEVGWSEKVLAAGNALYQPGRTQCIVWR